MIAHDIGGAVALRALLLEGARYADLTLVDAVGCGDWGTGLFRLVRENAHLFEQLPVYAHEALAESHLRFASHSGYRPDVLAAHLDPWRGEEGRAAYYRQYRQLEQAATDEFQHLLGSVPVPTRIIWGREDGFLPPPFAEQLHALIPHSELHWVEGAGHATPEDAPGTAPGAADAGVPREGLTRTGWNSGGRQFARAAGDQRVGSSTRAGASAAPSSWRKRRSAAVRPSGRGVLGDDRDAGPSRSASSMSSKPTRATGRSCSASTRTTVTVTRLLPAKSAVTGSGPTASPRPPPRTRSGSVAPRDIQRVLHRYPGVLHGRAVAAQPLGGGVDAGLSPMKPIRRWPWAIRWATPSRAPPKLSESTTSASIRPGRAVHEHRGDARLDLGLQIAVVVTGRDHDQPVHPAGAQRQHQLLLAVRVLGAGAVDQQRAVGAGHLLHRAAQRAVEGVGEILQDQADAGRTALAQHPRAVVAAEAERLDRLLDAALGVRGDARLAVHHPGDRLQAHSGAGGDVLHGRPVAVAGLGVTGGPATVRCPVVVRCGVPVRVVGDGWHRSGWPAESAAACTRMWRRA